MKKNNIEINENISIQNKFWIVQRIGITLMVGIFLASLYGLLGQGFFNHATAQAKTFRVTYPPFGRLQAATKIKVELPNQEHSAQIAISSEFLNSYTIESILPEPESVRMENGQFVYLFSVDGDLTATYTLLPNRPGISTGILTIENDHTKIRQVIYP